MKFILPTFLLLLLSLPASAQVAVSGNVQDVGVANVTSGMQVTFELQNFGGAIPRVPGGPVIGRVLKSFSTDASGNFTGSLYPNSVIEPQGTWYRVCVVNLGQELRCNKYLINGPFNLSNAVAITPSTNIGPNQFITESFPFTQLTPATTWTVTHNFNDSGTIVFVKSTAGDQIFPDKVNCHTDRNSCVLTFVTATAGFAIAMHAAAINIATNQPNAVLQNPTAPQAIGGNYSTSGAGTHSGTETFTGPLQVESGIPWIDVTGPPYNADPTGIADSTAAIQNAHNAAAAFALGPACVLFPYGTYKVTSLTWSPYVCATSTGRVILTTALASGNFVSISDQYGKPTPDPNSNGSTRSKVFIGDFHFINTNAANTAFIFFIGGATNANFATQLQIDGVNAVGFYGGGFKFGYNAFIIDIYHFFGQLNKGPYFSVAAGATGSGEKISIHSSTFGSTAGGGGNFLVGWNTPSGSDITFVDCSVDYLDGVNDPAQTAINAVVNMTDTHFEWSETVNPYINVNNGIQYRLVNFSVTSPTVAGFANPFVGKVAGTSTLSALNGRYILGANVGNLYDQSSGSGLLTLDPIFTSNVTPTTYFTQTGGPGAAVVFSGVPTNGPLTYDMSNYSVGIGNLYVGGNSGANGIAQIQSNNAATVAGVTASNLYILRAGIAGLAAQDSLGNLGLAGRIAAVGPVVELGTPCTNGELALSAGWQSTGSATVTAVAGNGQTCSWTITTGATTAANPTVTDTLTNALPGATTVCELNIHGGTHTASAGEGFQQTVLSATVPSFAFNGTPTAGGTTYLVTRRCGP